MFLRWAGGLRFPYLFVLFVLMFIINLFITPKIVVKYFQKKKGWERFFSAD